MSPRTVPRLHLITDPAICSFERLTACLPELLEAGLGAVQLRAPGLPTGQLLTVATVFRRLVRPPAVLLINDRVDLALLCQADGVHLPEQGFPGRVVRGMLGGGRLVGRSVHSVEAAQAAAKEGCDYLIYGNVYETGSKPGAPGRGLEALWTVVRAVPIPVIAIGGITPDRVPAVLAAGAHGVAVIRGILATDDPVEAVRAYRQAMDEVEKDGGPRNAERKTDRARGRANDR